MIPACLLSYQMLFAGKKAKEKKNDIDDKILYQF